MNKTIIKLSVIFAGAALLASCEETPEFKTTDIGPEMTASLVSNSCHMGDSLFVNVDLKDKIPLSTAKAKLLFDETVVDNVTVRTKTDGRYVLGMKVPFLKDIPNGTATVEVTSQNIRFGLSETTLNVEITRPEFEYLTFVSAAGDTYRMEYKGSYLYEYTGSLPAEMKGTISSPEVGGKSSVTFGWGNGSIDVDKTASIPFSNGIAGEYTLSFNTLTFEGAPFVSLEANGKTMLMTATDRYSAVINVNKGENIAITGYQAGFADWTFDEDFLSAGAEDGTYVSNVVDGLYKVTAEIDNKFIRVEAMKDADNYATLNADGSGALWAIGSEKIGKPTMSCGASWNPEKGGLCLAQVEPGVYQITLAAGIQLSCDDVNFKFFHQKTWGGEFGYANITTDSDMFRVCGPDSDSGNIKLVEGKTLEMGDVYRFTVTVSSSTSATMKVEKVGTVEVPTADVTVGGVKLDMVSADLYQGTVDLEQNKTVSVTGISDFTGWYVSPDFFDASSFKFLATSGKYTVIVNLGAKIVEFRKMNAAGTGFATLSDGAALWGVGWGIAHSAMSSNQPGWSPENGVPVAEIRPGVFQFTGIAVSETSTTIGGTMRFDYISCKFLHSNSGWDSTVYKVIAGNSADKIKLNDGGNIELASQLEENAVYRFTFDHSVAEPVLTFDKL